MKLELAQRVAEQKLKLGVEAYFYKARNGQWMCDPTLEYVRGAKTYSPLQFLTQVCGVKIN